MKYNFIDEMKLIYSPIILLSLLCTACPADRANVCLEATDTSAENLTIAIAAGDSCSQPFRARGVAFWEGNHEKLLWYVGAQPLEKIGDGIQLSTVTYNKMPPGLKPTQKAEPLQSGDEIVVEVVGFAETGPETGNSLKVTLKD